LILFAHQTDEMQTEYFVWSENINMHPLHRWAILFEHWLREWAKAECIRDSCCIIS